MPAWIHYACLIKTNQKCLLEYILLMWSLRDACVHKYTKYVFAHLKDRFHLLFRMAVGERVIEIQNNLKANRNFIEMFEVFKKKGE